MDSGAACNGNGNGSGNNYHRNTTYQTQKLEEFYKNCSHPDAAQQDQLSLELGIEPKKIKFWFQNRRTLAKAQLEKTDIRDLKLENENLKRENDELKACRELIRPKFVGSLHGSNRREVNEPEMFETAKTALAEVTNLLESWDPFWVKSPVDGRLVLDKEIYNNSFPKTNRFRNFTQIESSKDSTVVSSSARALVYMLMDPNKWLDLFPTIVAKARMIEVINASTIDNDAGTLQLMHAKLHILSPLVAPRDIYFLRYSKEIRPCRWVIVDVSCDYFLACSSVISWKRPSGCLIQDQFNGFSQITWMEHVEVDSRSEVNYLYRKLFSGGGAYGAERWLMTLQRMVERQQCYAGTSYHHEHGGICVSEMRKNMMDLSHAMVKKFVAMLSMSTDSKFNLELPNGGHISVNRSNAPGQAGDTVLAVLSSLWLPVSCEALFNFLRDEKTRSQWDVLSSGNAESEFAHISCGTHPGNRISLFKTSAPDMLLLQESCTHNLDSLIVYTPVRSSVLLESAFRGKNPDNISLVPSGFVISGDQKGKLVEASTSTSAGTNVNRDGSILTVALQVMTNLPVEKLPYKTVEKASTMTRSIVDKIKVALGCPL